ncbi:unnamed protein product [Brassica oleracea]|uniref:(rape) hypothetical protein n=1 Tax=Brassica napus TaxID=3708 RepID=A0A816N209_BRANA|nr:unnamed protein product [Brassica napus]
MHLLKKHISHDLALLKLISWSSSIADDQIWLGLDDYDYADRGVGMNIQALLSEFGDFGDFFENDALSFGEVKQLHSVLNDTWLCSEIPRLCLIDVWEEGGASSIFRFYFKARLVP